MHILRYIFLNCHCLAPLITIMKKKAYVIRWGEQYFKREKENLTLFWLIDLDISSAEMQDISFKK